MRVILTGGGTGGHIYPALAIAKGLLARDPETMILYIGTRNGMEASLALEAGLEFAGVSGRGLPRRASPDLLKTIATSCKAFWETKKILRRFHPDLVVGTGGYVSGPVVLTAAVFGFPTLLHEQNVWPGVTNRILARFVKRVMVTFPESMGNFRTKKKLALVGFPVRPELGRMSREAGARHFGLDPNKLTLLVTGGSRGAQQINHAMTEVLACLAGRLDIQVIWATGTLDHHEVVENLRQKGLVGKRDGWLILEYISDMPEALACADLFVGRAGAATLAELASVKVPGLLIPYPYAAGNHQEHNARTIVKAGAALMIPDSELSGERLWQEVERLLSQPALLASMGAAMETNAAPRALEKIIDICYDTAWR